MRVSLLSLKLGKVTNNAFMRNALLTRVTSENRYLETCGSFVWLRNERRTQSIVSFIKRQRNMRLLPYKMRYISYTGAH